MCVSLSVYSVEEVKRVNLEKKHCPC